MQDTNYWHGNMESKYIDAKKTLQTSFSPSLSIQTFSYQQNFYVKLYSANGILRPLTKWWTLLVGAINGSPHLYERKHLIHHLYRIISQIL